jgi:hypothetical protein
VVLTPPKKVQNSANVRHSDKILGKDEMDRAIYAANSRFTPVNDWLLYFPVLGFKLSVGSGIETANPVRPIRTVNFGNPADQLAESPTGSPTLSK